MAKKAYSVPVLILGSGGIDITDSQEGAIGGGDVQTDLNSYLLDGGLDQDMLNWMYTEYGSPDQWPVEGFNYRNSETWDVIFEYVGNHYPYF